VDTEKGSVIEETAVHVKLHTNRVAEFTGAVVQVSEGSQGYFGAFGQRALLLSLMIPGGAGLHFCGETKTSENSIVRVSFMARYFCTASHTLSLSCSSIYSTNKC
jgi:hypothetical protein